MWPFDVSISTDLPKRFIEMAFAGDAGSPIYLFEHAATVLTACQAAYRPGGSRRTCVLRIDNKAALDALIKASSSSAIGTFLANLLLSAEARCQAVWRFEYVSTQPNDADPPSRVCDTPTGVECTRWSGEAPPEFREYPRPFPYSVDNQLSHANGKIRLCGFLGRGGLGGYGLSAPPRKSWMAWVRNDDTETPQRNRQFCISALFLRLGVAFIFSYLSTPSAY